MSNGLNEATTELAYKESVDAVRTITQWYENLDTKIVALFSVSSAIAGLAPTFSDVQPGDRLLWLWILAIGAWFVSAVSCFEAFRPRNYRLDPDPRVLLDRRWLGIDCHSFRYHRLEDVAKTYGVNRNAYHYKVRAVTIAVAATALEVLAVSIALLVGSG